MTLNTSSSKKNVLTNQSGVVLILAVLFLAILLSITLAVLPWSLARTRKSFYERDYLSSFCLGEAGINQKIKELNESPSNTSDIPSTEPFGIGRGFYEVTYSSGPPVSLTSIGAVTGRKRTIYVELRDIAEALNKHAIYAPDVTVTSAVTGNIYYDNAGMDTISGAGANHTRTSVDSSDYPISVPNPDMNQYKTSATYGYKNGLCVSGPGPAPSGYNNVTDVYLFVGINFTGSIYIEHGDLPTITSSKSGLLLDGCAVSGFTAAEGDITLMTNATTIAPSSSNDPALIASFTGADNITLQDANHIISHLIYAAGVINISSGTINGCLVSPNSVTFSGNSLSYYQTAFLQNTPVYKHFSGGKRTCLLSKGNWEER